METLRHLFLAGNPVSLLPLYRERSLISNGSGLLVFDDLPVTHEELSAAKKELEFVEKRVWDIVEAESKNTDCVGAAEGASSRPMGAGDCLLRCLDVMHVGVKVNTHFVKRFCLCASINAGMPIMEQIVD